MKEKRSVGYYDESSFRSYRVRDLFEDVMSFLRESFLRSPFPEYRSLELRYDDGELEFDGLSSGGAMMSLGVLSKQTQYVFGDGGTFYPESTVVRFSLRAAVAYPQGVTESRLMMFDLMDYAETCLSLYQDEEAGRRLLMVSASEVQGRLRERGQGATEIVLSAQLTFDVQWDYYR